jgi:hypothetical protein
MSEIRLRAMMRIGEISRELETAESAPSEQTAEIFTEALDSYCNQNLAENTSSGR